MRFAVIHTVRVGQRVHRKVRLVINGVPERTDAGSMISVLEASGRAGEFSEAGVAWGNHEVRVAERLPKGTVDLDAAPTVDWSSMVDQQTVRRITLRLDAPIYDKVLLAAKWSSRSIQSWCVETLQTAALAAEREVAGPVEKPRRSRAAGTTKRQPSAQPKARAKARSSKSVESEDDETSG